jgi:predicted permease
MGFFESVLQDLRFSFRAMHRTLLATSVAVLSLALGIGANVAVFTVFDALLLRPIPVRNPGQIVTLSWSAKDKLSRTESTERFSFPVFEQFRRFSSVGVIGFTSIDGVRVIAGGSADFARGEAVSGNFHNVLGVAPAIGRLLAGADDSESAAPVCVLGYRFWQSHFGGDAAIIGQKVLLGDVPVTVVGVESNQFTGITPGYASDFRFPIHLLTQVEPALARPGMFLDPGNSLVGIIARIPAGARVRVRAELTALFRRSLPPDQQQREVMLSRLDKGFDFIRMRFRDPLLVLMAAVGLVLLIACANVANLLLACAKARERETAVRLALGAGRRRLARQLLTESLALAAMGAGLGIGLAYWASGALARFNGLAIDVRPEARVLAFTAAITSVTGILFGLAPALQVMRANLQPGLQRGGSPSRSGLASVLIVVQLALSLVTVVGAGLYMRTLHNLRVTSLGIDVHKLTVFRLYPRSSGYTTTERAAEFAQRVLNQFENTRAWESVALSRFVPLQSGWGTTTIGLPGPSPPADPALRKVSVNQVTARFFETLGIPVLLGRGFEEHDNERVAVVNETFGHTYFPDRSPIGSHFRENDHDYEIVGVVRDSPDLRESTRPTFFVKYPPNFAIQGFAVEVRAGRGRNAISSDVRRAMAQIDPNVPLRDLATAQETIDFMTRKERLLAGLSSIFGGLALLLAAVGLYGVRAYSVARRIPEIGIRVALGADRGMITKMILRETGWLALFGVSIGLAMAYVLARYIESMLYGVEAHDLTTFAGASTILITVAAVAGYFPARRAARIDPLVAVRHD